MGIERHRQETKETLRIESVQVVVMRDGERGIEVLLGKRTSGGFLNEWSCPGGKVDEGESKLDASVRELGEEIGVHLPQASFVYMGVDKSRTNRVDKSGKNYVAEYDISRFAVKYDGAPIEMSRGEYSEMRWVSLVEIVKRANAHEMSITPSLLRYLDSLSGVHKVDAVIAQASSQ